MQVSFDATITVGDDEDVEVSVEADFTPGHPGTMYARNGDPGDPPEGAEVEITSITDGDGNEIEYDSLSSYDRERLDEKAYEKGNEPQYDY